MLTLTLQRTSTTIIASIVSIVSTSIIIINNNNTVAVVDTCTPLVFPTALCRVYRGTVQVFGDETQVYPLIEDHLNDVKTSQIHHHIIRIFASDVPTDVEDDLPESGGHAHEEDPIEEELDVGSEPAVPNTGRPSNGNNNEDEEEEEEPVDDTSTPVEPDPPVEEEPHEEPEEPIVETPSPPADDTQTGESPFVPPPMTTKGRLTGGAIAGIVLSVLFLFVGVGGCFYVDRRRRGRQVQALAHSSDMSASQDLSHMESQGDEFETVDLRGGQSVVLEDGKPILVARSEVSSDSSTSSQSLGNAF